uniref:DEK_C domain-containing protein n=1 Tax=Caenorhabditis tropicalis TaxID=1561998 RepID=A0A1I7TSI7_9PELO
MADDLSSPPSKKRYSVGGDEYLLQEAAQILKDENVTATTEELRIALEDARRERPNQDITADQIIEALYIKLGKRRKGAVQNSDEEKEKVKRFSDPDVDKGAGPSAAGSSASAC